MDVFEFFVEGPPLSQQTKNPARLREWKEYQTRKTNIDGRFRVRHLSPVYARAFAAGKEFVYIRIEEAPTHEELL